MAYDPNGKILLYGGFDGLNTVTAYSDTWEWNGTAWNKLNPANSPGQRLGHAMAYDSNRNVTVLYGGTSGIMNFRSPFNDIWEWNGTNWTQITPANGSPVPPGRCFHAMAYDSVNKVMVILGGSTDWFSSPYGDTWTWNGATRIWTNVSNGAPPARMDFAMAYDSKRGVTVVFSGNGAGADTWEWNGTTWNQINPASSPVARQDHTMVYDGNQTILFGGYDGNNIWYNDTWVYDGTTWSQKTISPRPSARYGQSMAYDPGRSKTVLVGGRCYHLFNDTWELDSTNINALTWTTVNLYDPQARNGHAMAYDSLRRRTVLFGGETASMMQDTWEWDGITWTKMAPAYYIPNKRWYHSMAYDSLRNRTVLFGGLGASKVLQDIWDWDGKATYDPVRQKTVIFGGVNDTWEWDGIYSNWAQFTGLPTGTRNSFAMAYDSGISGNKTVLFGGFDGWATYYNDTWKWDGTTWTQLTTGSTVPSVRSNFAMGYDSTKGVSVLFGGLNGSDGTSVLNDTWELSGTIWSQLTQNLYSSISAPARRMYHAMAYDSVRRKTVLFGGISAQAGIGLVCMLYNDTWEWGQTYNTSGTYRSAPITPASVTSWGVLTYYTTLPANTSITVDVYDYSGGSTGIVLASNVPSGTNLGTAYPSFTGKTAIQLKANLSTTDPNVTPALTSWRVEYK
jgi:hypothetical protein